MKKKILEFNAMKRTIAFLLAFSFTLGSFPFTGIDVQAQDFFNGFKFTGEVNPVKAIPMYETDGQIVLDSDGFVWGNTASSGAKDINNATPASGTPLNRVRGIDKPISDIDAGKGGFNLAVSTDKKTLYIFGSSGNKSLDGAATKINDNVYKYDFYDKHGVTITDMSAAHNSGFVVDSKGDIWAFGWDWRGRGGSGQVPNKVAGKNISMNYAKNTNGQLDGTFNKIDAPENLDGQWPTVIATTDKGEIFMWGYDYAPGSAFNGVGSSTGSGAAATANTTVATPYFNNIFGTTDAKGNAYKLGVPIEIDSSIITATEGTNDPYENLAAGRGGFVLTKSGRLYYVGNAAYVSYGSPSGLGYEFGQTSANYTGMNKFIYTPIQIKKVYAEGAASSTVPTVDVTSTKFVDIDTSMGGSTALDSEGNVYHVGENWQTATDVATPDNYASFFMYKPRTSLKFASSAKYISDYGKIVEINTSRRATDYIVKDANGVSRAYTTGYEGGVYDATYVGNYTSTDGKESGKIDFVIENPLFKAVKGSGNVVKDITSVSTDKNSVLDANSRLYSNVGADSAGVTPKVTLDVTISKEVKTNAWSAYNSAVYSEMALTMHNENTDNFSSMRYVVVQPTNPAKYGDSTYYDLAINSLDKSMLPSYLKSKAATTTTEISVDAFEAMYADASITEKGTMTKQSGADKDTDTVWRTSGPVSGNAMVIACAKTSRNKFDYYATMAFPVDNYYKQTKSYYKGVADPTKYSGDDKQKRYAGLINIFGTKTIPGQYGVFVDDNNNVIYEADGTTYKPPNGVDYTPDLSTYTGPAGSPVAAGYYLKNTVVSPKLKYWQPTATTASQTLKLDPSNASTPFEVLNGKVDGNNTLTYEYEKDTANWSKAEVHYGYHNGSSYLEIGSDHQSEPSDIAIDESGDYILKSGEAENFWPNTTGSYSDGGDVFTPAPLNDHGINDLQLSLVGYKIGSAPMSESDYTKCSFAYDPVTGKFDFNPIVPTSGNTDVYLVYKSNTVSLYERYLNGDGFASKVENTNPANWSYNLTSTAGTPSTVVPLKADTTTSNAAVATHSATTTSGASVTISPYLMSVNPLVGKTNDNLFYEIDRVVGGDGLKSDGTKDTSYLYKDYFTRQAAVTNVGSIAKYEKPFTNIQNHILVGYMDIVHDDLNANSGKLYNFWNPAEKDFSAVPETINTAENLNQLSNINLVYLTDTNHNDIPDVMEGAVEEQWVAITASGSKVLMNRKFTYGYKDTTIETFTSQEDNFEVSPQWMYKGTTITTHGATSVEGAETGNKIVAGIPFVDDQPTGAESVPTYSKGKYTYGTNGFKTVTYYYNEDSNENQVIDVQEPVSITVKGINEQGKELYSYPMESSFSEGAFDIDAMAIPTYRAKDVEYNAAASKAGVVNENTVSNVTVVPSAVDTSDPNNRNLIITFIYEETFANITVNQYDMDKGSIGSFKTTVDFTKPYTIVVPTAKGHTFNEAKTLDPNGDGNGAALATTPSYSNGKITKLDVAEDGSTVVDLYYTKDSGNVTIYAIDIDTLGTPIIIGSTTNRSIGSTAIDPTKEENYPQVFEIPATSNYTLKGISTTNPFNPAFDIEGKTKATTQTFDGSTKPKDIYYFYERNSATVVSQAVDTSGNPITNLSGGAIADLYPAEVGSTETVTAPVDSVLRGYVLVGYYYSTEPKENVVNGGTATSVYVKDQEQKTIVNFMFRKLDPKTITNVSYVDKDNDGIYDAGEYLISNRTLNMVEGDEVTLQAPKILTYKYLGATVADATDQTISSVIAPTDSILVDADTAKTVYFRYAQDTVTIPIKAVATHGPNGTNVDISQLIVPGQEKVTANIGVEYTAYAPNVKGYILAPDEVAYQTKFVDASTTPFTFKYVPMEDVAADYMAKVKIRGLNNADDSVLYEYEVYATKGKDFTTTSFTIPTYKVLNADGTESDVNITSQAISIPYDLDANNDGVDDEIVVDFRYKSQEMKATAYFWDDENKEYITTNGREISGGMAGMPITAYPEDFNDYYYVGYSLTKPSATGATNIVYEPLASIDKLALDKNSIYFIYKKFKTENVKVYYVEDDGTYSANRTDAQAKKIIADAEADPDKVGIFGTSYATVTKTPGATVTVTAPNNGALANSGYKDAQDSDASPLDLQHTVTYVAGQDMYEVYFVYTKDTKDFDITAKLFEDEAMSTSSTPATKTAYSYTKQRVGESILVEPPYVSGYYTNDAPVMMRVGKDPVPTFNYIKWPQQTVTVVARENDKNGKILGTYTVTADEDAPVKLSPTNLIGWTYKGNGAINPAAENTAITGANTTIFVGKGTSTTVEYYYTPDVTTVTIKLQDTNTPSNTISPDLTFKTPSTKASLGYKLDYTAYAPNIKGYILDDPLIYYYNFKDGGPITFTFKYKKLDDIGKDYMASVKVVGRDKNNLGQDLYAYDMYIPLNAKTDIESLDQAFYVLASGLESETVSITPTRSMDKDLSTSTVELDPIVFLYESTIGQVNVRYVDETTGQVPIDPTNPVVVRRDATLGEKYTLNSDGIDNYYYLGYSLTGNPTDIVRDAKGRPVTTAKIDEIQAGDNVNNIYFHYKKITTGVFARYVEVIDGEERDVATVYVGSPTLGDYTLNADGTNVWGITTGEDLTDYLGESYYSIDTTKPTTAEFHSDGTGDQDPIVKKFYVIKDTRQVKAQLYTDAAYTIPVTEMGNSETYTCRIGEYTSVYAPSTASYVSRTNYKYVYIPTETENSSNPFEVKFQAKQRTSYPAYVNFIDTTDNSIFNTIAMNVLQEQQVMFQPKNQLGWKVDYNALGITSGSAIKIVGGTDTTVNIPYKPNVQKFNVTYKYSKDGTILGKDTYETPVGDESVPAKLYSDMVIFAKQFDGYLLDPKDADSKVMYTYTVNDYATPDTPIEIEINYLKVTDLLSDYTVNVVVKGVGKDEKGITTNLYEYTMTLPENTTADTVINKVQTVPDRYFYQGVTVTGGGITATDYTVDATDHSITLKKTNDSNAGAITITYDYKFIPLDKGQLTILAVDSATNVELSRNTFTADLGTKLIGIAPKITGYALSTTESETKEGMIQNLDTEVTFMYNALPTGNATVNYVAGGTTVKSETITGISAAGNGNYIIPDTFVANERIYNRIGDKVITFVDSSQWVGTNVGTYTANYVDAGPAKVNVTIQGPSGSTKTVYTEKVKEVEKIVEKPVPYGREVQPITSGKLYVGTKVGYVSGYSDDSFRPNEPVTRAEVAAMFHTLSTDPNKTVPVENQFTDLKDGVWYNQAVNYLASEGLLSGYGNGEFRPDAPVTRAEFAAITARFDDLNNSGVESSFPDVSNGHWAEDAIDNAYAKGWMGGYPSGEYRPNGNVTRAESVKVINSMTGRANKTIYTQADNKYSDVNVNHWAFQEIMEASKY